MIKVLLLFILFPALVFAQIPINPNGFNTLYYTNGVKSSEGTLRDGKPDGYWKTYSEKGIIKSEGNRKNFLLDSTWKFYSDSGRISQVINYKESHKSGPKLTYNSKGFVILSETYQDDIKDGMTSNYYDNGKLHELIPFVKGAEQGRGYEFDQDSVIITILDYVKGALVRQEKINRRDKLGRKQNIWKTFYQPNMVKQESQYYNNKKHGYFKYYDKEGSLVNTELYINDSLVEIPKEAKTLDTKFDFYPNAAIKFRGTYRDGKPEGVHRYYAEDGTVTASTIYLNNIVIGQGIFDDNGLKQGYWKEYYETGELRSEGNYTNSNRNGDWKFYHKNGKPEQTGKYKNNKPEGVWNWFYESGKLLREDNYIKGLEDGMMTEYDEADNIITQGNYLEGMKDGKWTYHLGNYREEGNYVNDQKVGLWQSWYINNNQIYTTGEFVSDYPDGKHITYYESGKVKLEGVYKMGKKVGTWVLYDDQGMPELTTEYVNGIEKKFNGVAIKPETTEPEKE